LVVKEPIGTETSSPIRITYFDFEIKKATKQFVDQLDKIPKTYEADANITGVTALLEIQKFIF
jgi:hypothetical protein